MIEGRFRMSSKIWPTVRYRTGMQFIAVLLTATSMMGCAFGGAAPLAQSVQLPAYQPSAATAAPVTTPATAPGVEQPVVREESESTGKSSTADAVMQTSEDSASSHPIYGAEIVADHQVVVASQVNGQIVDVAVEVGDPVQAGNVLVKLDSSALEAQAAQARAGLDVAASNLALLSDPAKEQDLAAAQAAVNAASAAYARASNGPTDEEQRLALAQLKQAEAAITVAQAAYNVVKGNPNIGMMPQSLQLQQATLAHEAAQAQYDKLMKGATPDQVAAAYAQLENARAQLQRLQDGAKPAQLAAAEAQVNAGEYAYYLAELQVSRATIKAPIDGVVGKVQAAAGALATPGAPLVTLLSNEVRVTIPVEESRLSELAVGQPIKILAAAYPEKSFGGVIVIIAPELDPTTRTVLVTIRPDDPEGLLAPGMSATVELLAN